MIDSQQDYKSTTRILNDHKLRIKIQNALEDAGVDLSRLSPWNDKSGTCWWNDKIEITQSESERSIQRIINQIIQTR